MLELPVMNDRLVEVPLGRRLDLLSGLACFEWIPARLIREMCAMVRVVRFASGEVIVRERDAGDQMFIIDTGTVSITTQGATGQVKLASMGPGEAFGEIALFTDAKIRRATVTAQSDVVALSIATEVLDRICEQFPEVRDVLENTASELTLKRIEALREAHLQSKACE
jgi:CRP/FNR family cyclic AMP-dependent transcriptional regulator